VAGHWGARPVPVLSSGKVSYEVGANIDATCFGGIAAVHRLVTKLGLVEQINQDLRLLKVHLPYHESDHVLNLLRHEAQCCIPRAVRRDWRYISGSDG
jgi:hypothetical protein